MLNLQEPIKVQFPYHPTSTDWEIYMVSAQSIHDLRSRALQSSLPHQNVVYTEDNNVSTWHFCLTYKDPGQEKKVASCVTLIQKNFPEQEASLHSNTLLKEQVAYEIRGLATEEKYRRRYFATRLVDTALRLVGERENIDLFWCSAPTDLIPFFQKKCDWTLYTPRFIPQDSSTSRLFIKRR